jgi:hypothetical protein
MISLKTNSLTRHAVVHLRTLSAKVLNALVILAMLVPNITMAAQAADGDPEEGLASYKKSWSIPASAELLNLPAVPGKERAAEMPPGLHRISSAVFQKNAVLPLEVPPPECEEINGSLDVMG